MRFSRLSALVFLALISLSAYQIQPPLVVADQLPFALPEATISDIHRALSNRTCTCEQLVTAYQQRIAAYDQPTKLNAIILTNPDALATARQLDAEFRRTKKLRPLHCIPVIVKDNYLTAGLQTTAGSALFKGFVPTEDAYQVRKLKKAGGIVLAKSNMAEWAFSLAVTISSIAGETRNPYNLDRTIMKKISLVAMFCVLTFFVEVNAQSTITYACGVKSGINLSHLFERVAINKFLFSYAGRASLEQQFSPKISLSYVLKLVGAAGALIPILCFDVLFGLQVLRS